MKRRTKHANWRTIRSKDQKVFKGKHDDAAIICDPFKLMIKAAKRGKQNREGRGDDGSP